MSVVFSPAYLRNNIGLALYMNMYIYIARHVHIHRQEYIVKYS